MYEPADGGEAETVVYDAERKQDTLITVKREGNTCSVEVTGQKPCRAKLMNAGGEIRVTGADFQMSDKTVTLFFAEGGTAEVRVG